ncbi:MULTISPECIES: YkvA family protein [Halomonas]|uniref:YkvA family protein n=1 Tax=Halomonas TaxID=2745 RepID=UPI0028F70AAA|nr:MULTISPECIES: DUF1232 domain-containing protein [Halomonas]MED5295221.1 DUF1232 domain-containing protein [Pseudomonadota bacterium]
MVTEHGKLEQSCYLTLKLDPEQVRLHVDSVEAEAQDIVPKGRLLSPLQAFDETCIQEVVEMSLFDRVPVIGRLSQRSRAFKHILRALKLFIPMLQDVLGGRYRPVPWSAFGWMAAALAYLVSPLDLVPDVLLLFGLVDDVVIVGWLLTKVDASLADYRAWRGDVEEDAQREERDISDL